MSGSEKAVRIYNLPCCGIYEIPLLRVCVVFSSPLFAPRVPRGLTVMAGGQPTYKPLQYIYVTVLHVNSNYDGYNK